MSCRGAICGIVALLSATAFSCSLAAEFRKVKVRYDTPSSFLRSIRPEALPDLILTRLSVGARRRRT